MIDQTETTLSDIPQNPLLAEITALERHVWNALDEGDTVADASLLSADFLGVYPDGFAAKSDHTGQLADGPTVIQYGLDGFHVRALCADHTLLSYRAKFQRTTRAAPEVMYVTSICQRSSIGWTNIFSRFGSTLNRFDPA